MSINYPGGFYMNSFKMTIKNIQSYDYIDMIKVISNELELNVITLQLALKIHEGDNVLILFKESEVIITKDFGCFIGIENVIPSNIVDIKIGNVFSEVLLDSKCGLFKALLTIEALRKIKIYIGERVYALIKSNEIALGV
jgi:molybdate transport system regulatory protein